MQERLLTEAEEISDERNVVLAETFWEHCSQNVSTEDVLKNVGAEINIYNQKELAGISGTIF